METLWLTVEGDIGVEKHKRLNISCFKKESERNLIASASCMLIMLVTSSLSNNIEAQSEKPRYIYEIICYKFYNKDNNNIEKLGKYL